MIDFELKIILRKVLLEKKEMLFDICLNCWEVNSLNLWNFVYCFINWLLSKIHNSRNILHTYFSIAESMKN